MAFIPTPTAARCAIRYVLFGQDVVNTLWYLKSSEEPFVTDDLIALNDLLIAWAQDTLLLALSHDIQLADVTSTAQDSVSAPSVTSAYVGTNGSEVSDSLPGNVCLTVTFGTAARGRSSRGRNYIGGIPRSQVLDNAVLGTWGDDVLTACESLAFLDVTSFLQVVVSHFHLGAARSEGLAQIVTNARLADLTVDTQRRRLH